MSVVNRLDRIVSVMTSENNVLFVDGETYIDLYVELEQYSIRRNNPIPLTLLVRDKFVYPLKTLAQHQIKTAEVTDFDDPRMDSEYLGNLIHKAITRIREFS